MVQALCKNDPIYAKPFLGQDVWIQNPFLIAATGKVRKDKF